MQKIAQIEVSGRFIKFGWVDSSDIANADSAKCFSTFADVSRPCIINYLCIISIIYAKKSPKSGFGHFIKFGWFDMADIAYSDKQKRCSITMGNAHAGKGH